LKITRILPKFLAKTYQVEDLRRAEIQLQYYQGMVRVLEERISEGKEELQKLKGGYNWMYKFIFLILIVIGFVAFTGIDVTSEYEAISNLRTQFFDELVDPLTKKALKHASESNLNEVVEEAFAKYGDGGNEV